MTERSRKGDVGPRSPTVAIRPFDAANPAGLGLSLTAAGFWPAISAALTKSGRPASDFPVLIKPDLGAFDTTGSTATEAWQVELLVDMLHEHGYPNVAVGVAPDGSEQWLENRDALLLADILGYRGRTPSGADYELLDLSLDVVELQAGWRGLTANLSLSRAWFEAGFRVSFAKNKTHPEFFYALSLANLLGLSPSEPDRTRQPWDEVAAISCAAPVDFALIDATASSDGSFGPRRGNRRETGVVIAGCDALAVDWAGATKMKVDPWLSALNRAALGPTRAPPEASFDGDLSVYTPWCNVHPMCAETARRLRQEPSAQALFGAAFLDPDPELFPFRDPVQQQLSAKLAPLLRAADDAWVPLLTALLGAGAVSSVGHALSCYRTLFDKGSLPLRDVPVDLDLGVYTGQDYEAIVPYVASYERLIEQTPCNDAGLGFRYVGGAVLFRYSRLVAAPFDSFVARVDIARAIRYMTDYAGGSVVAVRRDADGRVTQQAERNLYLPQPNYLVLFGGEPIDVTKLEHVDYRADSHKICWRTVKSNNRSAELDDGCVSFVREGDATRLTIVALQKFKLPPIAETWQLDLNPPLKDALVADAYQRFFDTTAANFELVYLGSPLPGPRQAPPPSTTPAATPLLAALRSAASTFQKVITAQTAAVTDPAGFRHFAGPERAGARLGGILTERAEQVRAVAGGLNGFLRGLASSVLKDVGLEGDG